jgi:hypothetical protein
MVSLKGMQADLSEGELDAFVPDGPLQVTRKRGVFDNLQEDPTPS